MWAARSPSPPATLTVTADNLTRPQGEANPPLTYTFSGLVNGDTASVVSGTPILSTTATIASPNGQYPIAITARHLSAANYDFTTVGGTLTVTGPGHNPQPDDPAGGHGGRRV